jgi:hypothetical protein
MVLSGDPDVFLTWDAEDIKKQVNMILSKLNPSGGYFVGSSTELHTAVPLVNAMAMYNTIHSFTR